MNTTRALALLALTALLAPSPARADAAAEARFHDDIARRAFAARRYEEAARAFMVEQRLAPNPNIVFNIALCLQQLQRHGDAYMYFAEYLASDDQDPARREQAREALAALRPRVALVTVESEPHGAAIFVDRRELGQYGVTPRVLALAAGPHRIWVEKDGYRAAETSVELGLGSESRVALAPEQILGRLRVSAPTAARVRVLDPDGNVVVEGDAPLDRAIAPGTYRAEARAGVERWSEPVVVRAEQTSELSAQLVGPTGDATVTANVAGALVSLDGRDRGFTPQVLAAIPAGEHTLEVRAEGMRTYSGRLAIEDDDHAWVTVYLEPDRPIGVADPTWVLTGITLALGIAAGVTTGFAADASARFADRQRMLQPSGGLADESRALNVAADAIWIGAGVAAIVTLILLATTSDFDARPSRAAVSRGGR